MGGTFMAKIPAADFQLITETQLMAFLETREELRMLTFEGYCSLTETRLFFGPAHTPDTTCMSCLPEDHMVMMPMSLLEVKRSPVPGRHRKSIHELVMPLRDASRVS
jgi:hypothetical protein